MLARTLLGAVALAVSNVQPVGSATVHVPGDHATVQAGVNAAAAGDTVLVAPGEYRELVRLKNGIVLRSAEGPDSTIFHSPDLGETGFDERVLECMDDIDRSTVIEGFTFVTDPRVAGTAIHCAGGSPTIRGNVIKGYGWGIQLRNSNALVEGNIIDGCSGFAILVFASSPEIIRNVIRNNGSQAISISGKDSHPVIGGSRENANRIHGNQGYSVVNHSRNDIDATWNDWGWEVTAVMNREGWPADIATIQDGNEKKARLARGRGKVDYRHWITVEPEGGTPGAPSRLILPVVLGVLALAILLVVVRRVGGSRGAV